jgi:hypothetical protein
MIRKLVFVAACLLVAVPTHAGGFLADLMKNISPGLGAQLDEAHRQLGQPHDRVEAVEPDARAGINRSQTCVTPRGSCQLDSTLHGTTCFCSFDSDQVLGRMQ